MLPDSELILRSRPPDIQEQATRSWQTLQTSDLSLFHTLPLFQSFKTYSGNLFRNPAAFYVDPADCRMQYRKSVPGTPKIRESGPVPGLCCGLARNTPRGLPKTHCETCCGDPWKHADETPENTLRVPFKPCWEALGIPLYGSITRLSIYSFEREIYKGYDFHPKDRKGMFGARCRNYFIVENSAYGYFIKVVAVVFCQV